MDQAEKHHISECFTSHFVLLKQAAQLPDFFFFFEPQEVASPLYVEHNRGRTLIPASHNMVLLGKMRNKTELTSNE